MPSLASATTQLLTIKSFQDAFALPGRSGKAADVLINHVGLFLGVALTWKRWLPKPSVRLTCPQRQEG